MSAKAGSRVVPRIVFDPSRSCRDGFYFFAAALCAAVPPCCCTRRAVRTSLEILSAGLSPAHRVNKLIIPKEKI